MGGRSYVSVLETIYDVEQSDEDWLRGIATATEETLGHGFGAFAMSYESAVPRELKVHAMIESPGAVGLCAYIEPVIAEEPEEKYAFCWKPCALASETADLERTGFRHFTHLGIRDLVVLSNCPSPGTGTLVAIPLPRQTHLSTQQHTRLSRIARHLTQSHRLRTAPITNRRPEAILAPDGAILHSEGALARSKEMRDLLAHATVELEALRMHGRLDDASAADLWPELVGGRWSLVESFDSDGKRYILARRNDAGRSPLDVLSKRERQVVAFLANGHSPKWIAFELGLAMSTVRVLVSRVYTKLGIRTRDDLLALIKLG